LERAFRVQHTGGCAISGDQHVVGLARSGAAAPGILGLAGEAAEQVGELGGGHGGCFRQARGELRLAPFRFSDGLHLVSGIGRRRRYRAVRRRRERGATMFGFLRRKAKVGTPSDEDVIQGYGRVLGQQTGDIMDEKLLPYPKDVIKAALVRWIPKVSGDVRKHMESGLVTLAQFQPDVGNARYPSGIGPELLDAAMAEADGQKAAKMMLAAIKQGGAVASDELLARVAAEERELLALSQSLR
jgi:hypothetical protein